MTAPLSCPTPERHTPGVSWPSSSWPSPHLNGQDVTQTHYQLRCPGCGLYKIYVRKPACPKCGRLIGQHSKRLPRHKAKPGGQFCAGTGIVVFRDDKERDDKEVETERN